MKTSKPAVKAKKAGRMMAVALMALMAFTGVSCTTTAERAGETNWMQVQGISGDFRASDLSAQMNPTTAIQPEGYTTSPVIDIESLKVIEGFSSTSASSVTLEQDALKTQIREQVEAGDKLVDRSLPEDSYSEVTSGTIATDAESDSFRYLSSRTSYSNSIAEYDYTEGCIYEIITSPGSVTDIRLQPGESLSGSPIMNNGTSQWQFTGGTSVEDGTSVQHIFVRPLIAGLDTTMILLTNLRTYYLRVASFEKSHMVAVRWRYPSEKSTWTGLEGLTGTALGGFNVDIGKCDYKYSIEAGSKVKWKPTAVFSSENKTYITFPATMLATDTMPAVYLRKDGKDSLVNFRISNDGLAYQIDAVPEDGQYILLKSGQKETVKIKRVK